MRFAFDPRDGLVVVSARLWGPSGTALVHLALDTGATSTIINADVLFLLGYDPAVAEERVRITTASGVEYAANIPLSHLAALGRERQDFPVLCHTLPMSAIVDGLLGLDFFRELRLGVDFRDGYIEPS